MTTVIYRNGKLYADSRVTYHRKENGEHVLHSVRDDFAKIIEPDHLNVGGAKVHALAFAGDINLIKYAQEIEKVAKQNDETVNMLDPAYYTPFLPYLQYDSQMLAVTTKAVYLLNLTKRGMTTSMTDPRGWFVFGTGTNTPNLQETILKISAEVAMQDVLAYDKNTGGLVQFWKYGKKGITTLDLSHKTTKLDRFMLKLSRRIRDYRDATSVNVAMKNVYGV